MKEMDHFKGSLGMLLGGLGWFWGVLGAVSMDRENFKSFYSQYGLYCSSARVSLSTNGNVNGLKVERAVQIRSLNKHMTRPSLNNELYHALQTL